MSNTIDVNTRQSFQIFNDRENNPSLRKIKRENAHNNIPISKRQALSSITNTVRVQSTYNGVTRSKKQNLGPSSKDFCVQKTFAPVTCGVEPGAPPGMAARRQPSVNVIGHHRVPALSNAPVAAPRPRGLRVFQDVTAQHVNNASRPNKKVAPPVVVAASRPVLGDITANVLKPSTRSAFHATGTTATTTGCQPMELDDPLDQISAEFARKEQHQKDVQTSLQRVWNVPYYSGRIYDYLKKTETRNLCRASYMGKQPDITGQMRTILGDWLIEVAEEYKLQRETLFLAVNYIDRFLSRMSVLRGKLQLLGTAAIFLASKYEEIYPPEVNEFVYITDDTYTKSQVLRMEQLILKVLNFDLSSPTCNCFAEKFIMDLGYTNKSTIYFLTMYLIEMTILDMEAFIVFRPSKIAASAVCLANFTLKQQPWSRNISEKSTYFIKDFAMELKTLHTAYLNITKIPQQSLQDKYKNAKYRAVSLLCPPATLDGILA